MGEYSFVTTRVKKTNIGEITGALSKIVGMPYISTKIKDDDEKVWELVPVLPAEFIRVVQGNDDDEFEIVESVKWLGAEKGKNSSLSFWAVSQLGRDMGDAVTSISDLDGDSYSLEFPSKLREDYSLWYAQDKRYTNEPANVFAAFASIFREREYERFCRRAMDFCKNFIFKEENGHIVIPNEAFTIFYDTYEKYGKLLRTKKEIEENRKLFYNILTYEYYCVFCEQKEDLISNFLAFLNQNFEFLNSISEENLQNVRKFYWGFSWYFTQENILELATFCNTRNNILTKAFTLVRTLCDIGCKNIYLYTNKADFMPMNIRAIKTFAEQKWQGNDWAYKPEFYSIDVLLSFNPNTNMWELNDKEQFFKAIIDLPFFSFLKAIGYYMTNDAFLALYQNENVTITNVKAAIVKSKAGRNGFVFVIPENDYQDLITNNLDKKVDEFFNEIKRLQFHYTKVYLKIPFSEKDEVKKIVPGIYWDADKKRWFVYRGNPNFDKLGKWMIKE